MPDLRPADFTTDTWDRLMADMRARQDALRRQNDGDLDPVETAVLRGRLRELSYWLRMSSAAPGPPRE